jgi:sodium/hydrogen exchanger-like protein 6/7
MEFLTAQGLLGIIGLMTFIFASTYIPTCKIQIIHETSLTVILGFLGGIIIKEQTHTFVAFNDQFFFYYILPLILFTEGYTMKHRQFFRNIGSILLFGVVGTIICFLVNCYGTYLLSEYGSYIGLDQKLTLMNILEIGAVLSESDTVAAIAVISDKDSPQVRSILLGEGVVNDAVAIVLFHSAMQLSLDTLDSNAAFQYLSEFAFMCVTSILLGFLCGILSALVTRNFKLLNTQPHHEVALLFLLAYLGYILSMMVGASGVLAILTTAIMMAHYSWYNISEEARFLSKGSFHVLGETTEAFVYVYIGFSAYEHFTEIGGFRLMLGLTLVVLISRFLAVVLLPGLLKLCCSRMTLGWGELMAIWFAGSIRGAVAFALISASEDSETK